MTAAPVYEAKPHKTCPRHPGRDGGAQITDGDLPTREPKRKSAADRKWGYDFACELDAIPPDQLRDLVEDYINLHLPQDKLEALKAAEESEREIIARLVGRKLAPKKRPR